MDTSTFVITADMLAPVTTQLTSAINVAVPIGIGVFAIILGVKFVPKLIKIFIH